MTTNDKYRITDETRIVEGCKVHRIIRVRDNFRGGFIEDEDNLSYSGNCWIHDNAVVMGEARLSGDANITDTALVKDFAKIGDRAFVGGDTLIAGSSRVNGGAYVVDNCRIDGRAVVGGRARLHGHVRVTSEARIDGWAIVNGHVLITDQASITDNAHIDAIEHDPADYDVIVSDDTTLSGCMYIRGGHYATSADIIYLARQPVRFTLTKAGIGIDIQRPALTNYNMWAPWCDNRYRAVEPGLDFFANISTREVAVLRQLLTHAVSVAQATWHTAADPGPSRPRPAAADDHRRRIELPEDFAR